MRDALPGKLEHQRLRTGPAASNARSGMAGAFKIMGPCGSELLIVSSGVDRTYGWEHVSVSIKHRTPNWMEMCWVKDQFWNEDECAVQYHPPRDEYINYHPYCLHLFRPLNEVFPMPPTILIGPKTCAPK
jgi:hypothetical protein